MAMHVRNMSKHRFQEWILASLDIITPKTYTNT
jgi:hypothetical protein